MPQDARTSYTQAIPCFKYADASAAIEWLVEVLGAETRQVHPAPDGRVAHAELWFGGGCVMLGSTGLGKLPARSPGQGCIYLALDGAGAVDATYERVRRSGARVVMDLHDTDYGSRDFTCEDPEGNLWSFGSYSPA